MAKYHINGDQCILCGLRLRPTDLKLPVQLPPSTLNPDGTFRDNIHWFCSANCYIKAIAPLVSDPRYGPDKDYLNDPGPNLIYDSCSRRWKEPSDWIDHILSPNWKKRAEDAKNEWREAAHEWQRKQIHIITDAENELVKRMNADIIFQAEQRAQEEMERERKEAERKQNEQQRLEERQKREQERQEEKRKRDEEKQKREQERLEEMRAKEEEKLRKEQERVEQLREREIPEEAWFSGCHIVAPQGRGKTTLLLALAMPRLKQCINEKNCSVVIMDSKGEFVQTVERLRFIQNRLTILDPSYPIAINPLSVSKQKVSVAVSRLEYIFSALLEAKITPKQSALFRSVLRALIIGFENTTLETFRDIIANGVRQYQEQIAKLPSDLQEFFTKEFDRDYDTTRNELKWRLRLVMENDFLRRIMNAPATKFDMAKEMDEARVIVINNNQYDLGTEGCEFFGRFFLAQIWNAATARSVHTGYKKPVYVFIDEAQTMIYRDEMVAKILDELRSQRISLIMAHQRIEQIDVPNVLSALFNCAIRISNADDEAKVMADKLRTDVEHFNSLKLGQFAVFVRGLVQNAFTMTVRPYDFAPQYMMTDVDLAHILNIMAHRYGYKETTEPPKKEVAAPAAIQEKAQPAGKPAAPAKPSKPVGDAHTGEHTEPAKTWGSKK